MPQITDQAAEQNREAWDSFRRQRDEGLVNIRPDSAGDILAGRRFLYPENLELVGGVQGKRLLDMGCGDGAEMLEWARAGAIVTGVDNSPVQLASARRNAERLGVECRLVQADLLRLPEDLLQGEFDIVFSAWVEAWIGDLDGWFGNAGALSSPAGDSSSTAVIPSPSTCKRWSRAIHSGIPTSMKDRTSWTKARGTPGILPETPETPLPQLSGGTPWAAS